MNTEQSACHTEFVDEWSHATPCPAVQEAAERAVDLARENNETYVVALNDMLLRFTPCPEEKGGVHIHYKKRWL